MTRDEEAELAALRGLYEGPPAPPAAATWGPAMLPGSGISRMCCGRVSRSVPSRIGCAGWKRELLMTTNDSILEDRVDAQRS